MRTLLTLLACVALVLVACSTAQAATVTMVHDQSGDENWNQADDGAGGGFNDFWSDGAAASSGNDYVVGNGFTARITTAVPSTFNGDTLTVQSGGLLALRQQDGNTATVNLTLDGGELGTHMPGLQHLTGSLDVTSNGGTIDLDRANRNITFDVGVTGTGTLTTLQGVFPGGAGSSTLWLMANSSFFGYVEAPERHEAPRGCQWFAGPQQRHR